MAYRVAVTNSCVDGYANAITISPPCNGLVRDVRALVQQSSTLL